MHLRLLPDLFGVVKLPPPQPFPAWLSGASMFFVSQTEDEYTMMCPQHLIPEQMSANRGHRCWRVEGDLAFDEVGVVARVSKPLADAGLSLLLISTHDRDYVLVHERDLETAVDVYRKAGFSLIR